MKRGQQIQLAVSSYSVNHVENAIPSTAHNVLFTQAVSTKCTAPNEICLFAAGSTIDIVHSQTFRTFSTRQIAILMPALLLRIVLHCAGDIEMNPGPDSTPTSTNCLRMMQ